MMRGSMSRISSILEPAGKREELIPILQEAVAPLEESEEKMRPPMPYLSVDKRIRDFSQVELGYSDEMAMEEAERCLRCDLEEREET